MADQTLLKRLEVFELDQPGTALTFSRRLARENNWSHEYSLRVIREYKRFLYLSSLGQGSMTPSDQVDQAWHLHLTYTRSYWGELCQGVLGFELHHLPTEGGIQEQHKFRERYTATLMLYRQTFGKTPPADIWPDVDARFSGADRYVRINRREHWLVPRPRSGRRIAWMFAPAVVLLPACSKAGEEGNDWFWLKLIIGVAGFLYIARKLNDWLGGGRGGFGGGSGCGSGCSGCGGCGGD